MGQELFAQATIVIVVQILTINIVMVHRPILVGALCSHWPKGASAVDR